ncbi:MAG: glycosyltransferase [Phycisphaerae bacterium]
MARPQRFENDFTDCYRRNIAALTAFQPDVAAIVDAASIPDGVTSATGRDGSRTFLIPSNDGRLTWFGQSSMPTVSAAEVFAGFLSDGANITLPGVLTGVEPLVVAGKLPAHAALFIVEQSPLQLKLAMHLHDYADLLAAGRLVFVLDEDGALAESLRIFFERHPGYELPVHLLTVPQRSAAEITELQRGLEEAGQVVLDVHTRMVDSSVKRLGSRTVRSLPSAPRVAVLSVDPRPASLEQAGRIGRGLTRLGWPHELCIPDAPGKCHLAARLQAIDNVAADLVLFVNGGAGSMCALLPDELPVASWYFPEAIVQPPTTEAVDRRQVAFAATQAVCDALVGAGIPASLIEGCALAADDTMYGPVTLSQQESDALHVDVAVLMNLPDDRPEACNVELVSHVALWRALQASVKRNVDRYRNGIAEELLDEAQRDSGTTLSDAMVREHFLGFVRSRIAPATIARAAAEVLTAKSCHVWVWGHNWPSIGQGEEIRRGAIPVADALNRIMNAAGVVLLPDSSPLAIQTALDALAAGAHVICRAPDEPFERAYPGLAGLAPHLHFYRTSRELEDLVRRLKSRERARSDQPDAARTMVLKEHSVAQRLRFIVKTLRERQTHNVPSG